MRESESTFRTRDAVGSVLWRPVKADIAHAVLERVGSAVVCRMLLHPVQVLRCWSHVLAYFMHILPAFCQLSAYSGKVPKTDWVLYSILTSLDRLIFERKCNNLRHHTRSRRARRQRRRSSHAPTHHPLKLLENLDSF